jgi:hypothetical protein
LSSRSSRGNTRISWPTRTSFTQPGDVRPLIEARSSTETANASREPGQGRVPGTAARAGRPRRTRHLPPGSPPEQLQACRLHATTSSTVPSSQRNRSWAMVIPWRIFVAVASKPSTVSEIVSPYSRSAAMTNRPCRAHSAANKDGPPPHARRRTHIVVSRAGIVGERVM